MLGYFLYMLFRKFLSANFVIYEDEFLKLFSEFFLTKVVFFLTCSPYGMCAAQAQRYNMQLLGPWK